MARFARFRTRLGTVLRWFLSQRSETESRRESSHARIFLRRNLIKMEEERERLRLRQVDLARQREQLEENQQNKSKKVTIKIQTAYPGFLEPPIVTTDDG